MNIDWTLFKDCFPLALAQCEDGGRNTALLAAMGTISGTHRYNGEGPAGGGKKGMHSIFTSSLSWDVQLDMLLEIRSI